VYIKKKDAFTGFHELKVDVLAIVRNSKEEWRGQEKLSILEVFFMLIFFENVIRRILKKETPFSLLLKNDRKRRLVIARKYSTAVSIHC
jgi:hypothetical protein